MSDIRIPDTLPRGSLRAPAVLAVTCLGLYASGLFKTFFVFALNVLSHLSAALSASCIPAPVGASSRKGLEPGIMAGALPIRAIAAGVSKIPVCPSQYASVKIDSEFIEKIKERTNNQEIFCRAVAGSSLRTLNKTAQEGFAAAGGSPIPTGGRTRPLFVARASGVGYRSGNGPCLPTIHVYIEFRASEKARPGKFISHIEHFL